MNPVEIVRALVEGLSGEGVVSVRVEWLQALVARADGAPAPLPGVEVDLTCEEVAEQMKCHPSLVRGWCRAHRFPGAYKRAGKSWRIPREAVAAFQRDEAARFQSAA